MIDGSSNSAEEMTGISRNTTIGGSEEFDQVRSDIPGESFSRFLLSDNMLQMAGHYVNNNGCNHPHGRNPFDCGYHPSLSSLFSVKTPGMLRFGDYCEEDGGTLLSCDINCGSSPAASNSSGQNSIVIIDSTPPLPKSPTYNNNNIRRKIPEVDEVSGSGAVIGTASTGSKKRRRADVAAGRNGSSSYSGGRPKGTRVKLGDRVAALQQQVSPYGKMDMASVLHESIGYIKLLQDQVKVMCSPYLHSSLSSSSSSSSFSSEFKDREGVHGRNGLKRTGLCLVPLQFISHVTDVATITTTGNVADFWSHAVATRTSPAASSS